MLFPKSIRWRLQLWLAFLLVCVLSGFGASVYQLQRGNQLRQIDEELEHRLAAVSKGVRARPPPDRGPGRSRGGGGPHSHDPDDARKRPPSSRGRPDSPSPDGPAKMRDVQLSPEVLSLFDETRPDGFYFTAWYRDGALLKRSANAPNDLPRPDQVVDVRIRTRMRGAFREAFHFTELRDCVLVGRSITADLQATRRFAWWLLAAGGTVLALGLWVGWGLTTRAIRPVEQISAAASRISAGNLSERISVADADNELGRLGGVLNSTFARLEAAFARQTQFTADASHELRTPLSVIICEAQTALARPRTGPEYRETVETCLDAAQRMRRLIESLLHLARSDAEQEQIPRARVDVAEVARACVERIRPLARERRIHCDLEPAETWSNSDRIGQVITNLLTNAIQYNKPTGEVRVRTRAENGRAVIAIADTGHGIGPEDLPHVFERFYRADKARSRANGRSGLGLAICKAIVDADGGSVVIASEPGAGTTVTVRLPGVAARRKLPNSGGVPESGPPRDLERT